VSFLVDREREPRSYPRTARIAVGAALECALLRAGRMGATVRFDAPRPGALVTVTITDAKRMVEPDKALMRRVTNRRLYDGRAIDDATHSWLLEACPPLDGVRTLFFGRERVRALGPIVEEAETLFYGDPRLRENAVGAVRFDVRDREEVSRGLSLGCLELSAPERAAMDALRKATPERPPVAGAAQRMGTRARRQIESASGVCVITRPASTLDPLVDVQVGRCLQRAWLALTRKGLAAQPMTAVLALETVVGAEGSGVPERERIEAVVTAFHATFPGIDKGSVVGSLLRFGWAPDPTGRVRRLPLADSVTGPLPA